MFYLQLDVSDLLKKLSGKLKLFCCNVEDFIPLFHSITPPHTPLLLFFGITIMLKEVQATDIF